VRIHPPQLTALNSWIAKQPDDPSRPESIRRLLDIALGRPAEYSSKKTERQESESPNRAADRPIEKLGPAEEQHQTGDRKQKFETLAPDEAFALMLETACEDFANLQDRVNKRMQIVPSQHEASPLGEEERWTAVRAKRVQSTNGARQVFCIQRTPRQSDLQFEQGGPAT
jgi:hypothetical protein